MYLDHKYFDLINKYTVSEKGQLPFTDMSRSGSMEANERSDFNQIAVSYKEYIFFRLGTTQQLAMHQHRQDLASMYYKILKVKKSLKIQKG